MIREFNYYIENNFVKKCTPNLGEAESLINKAIKRLEYIKIQKITNATASFIFEDIYEAFREASQAIMALKGYKPFSHEALIYFLKEFYTFSELELTSFNRYRILRNKTIYSAEVISEETCKASLKFLESFLPKLKHRNLIKKRKCSLWVYN